MAKEHSNRTNEYERRDCFTFWKKVFDVGGSLSASPS
jgi:hypothetical protein